MHFLSLRPWALWALAAILATQPQGSVAAADALLSGWVAVPFPNAGELRYRPPAVTERDYPPRARDAGIEGTTLLRLEVDPQGRIIGCEVARSAGLAELDVAACEIYRSRALFKLSNIPGPIRLEAPVTWQLQDADQVDGEWPIGRPVELLQARRCWNAPSEAEVGLEMRDSSMLALEALPECLHETIQAIAERALGIAGDPAARVVVRVRVGRAWNEASLHYALPGSTFVRQPVNMDPVSDLLSSEWQDYVSPDGELGWSGFLLLVEEGRIKVRFLSNERHPSDIWFNSNAIQAEFFPGLIFIPAKAD